MTHRRATTALATTAAALLALTACSSGSSAEDDLKAAVQDNITAYNDGDLAAARALLSERCRAETSEDDTRETIELIDQLYGDITLQDITVHDIDGDTARVSATTGIQALDDAGDDDGAQWVYEDGAWRTDDC